MGFVFLYLICGVVASLATYENQPEETPHRDKAITATIALFGWLLFVVWAVFKEEDE